MDENLLPSLLQQYTVVSKYSRWIDEEKRREIWPEPVQRYIDNVVVPVCTEAGVDGKEIEQLSDELLSSISRAEVFPSMRSLMTAGPALDRDHAAGYNCAFIAVDHQRAFDETLYLLSCGCGVGFSVERQFINNLPEVPEEMHESDTVIVVPDSKIGWATSLRQLISLLYAGQVPKWDVSRVRQKGARLKTFGGRASGPDPLVDLFKYVIKTFEGSVGRKLNSIECHGIICKIGEAIVVGGVRRSATLSLSNLTDQRMRNAKAGQWHIAHPEYTLANNSVAYTEKPDTGIFLEEWTALYNSKSGERGIFNRQGVQKKAKRLGKRDPELIVGTNPCGEISLRSCGFCNLSTIVIRGTDTKEDLKRKFKLAAKLGTIQSTFVDFRYLRPIWRKNAEEERLLGVSMTGIYDHPVMSGKSDAWGKLEDVLEELREVAVSENASFAEKLGINPSTAVTTIKPEGTTSSASNSSSGIHMRHSKYYIRSVRQDNKDAVTAFLKDQGVPNEPCVIRPESTTVFYFPIKSPDTSTLRSEVSALEHLELWSKYNKHWSEHQVSVTVNIRDGEWISVAAWVYKNWDEITGISFLPYNGGSYKQAPFQECDEQHYNDFLKKMPERLDWSKLSEYEYEDTTEGVKELACVGGACEI